jgi:hypothetical protein
LINPKLSQGPNPAKYSAGLFFCAHLQLGDGSIVSIWLSMLHPTMSVSIDTHLRAIVRWLTFAAAGDPTGSPSGPPPPVSSEIASAAQNAAKEDAMGNNVPGQDQQDNDSGQTVMGAAGKPKTAKESMNENAEGPH